MNNWFSYFLLSCISLTTLGCNDMPLEPLTMQRMDNNTSLLKLDGYYFFEWDSDVEAIKILFLYQNGVLLNGLSPDLSSLPEVEERFKSGAYVDEFASQNASAWGIYKLEDDRITIEQWVSGNQCCETVIRSGVILNDSSFIINNEQFTFKPFSPKPDSTNVFIN